MQWNKIKKKTIKKIMILSGIILILCLSACRKEQTKTDRDNHWQDTDFAMGTVISQNVYSANEEEIAEKVLSTINELENTISWRIQLSPVALINEAAGTGKKIEVEEKLVKWLSDCQDVYERSQGALDITVGPASRLWDIGGDNPKVATAKEVEAVLPLIDGSKVQIDGEKVSLDIKGGQLDLGAVGKGIACDEIGKMLTEEVSSDFQVNGTFSVGGSVLIYGEKPDGTDWKIGVQNPRGEEGENMGVLTIRQKEKEKKYVSTSGDYEKYIEKDGVRYHHIMDPRTGSPADSGLISVTIISESGFLSDALSTACFVLGLEDGMKLTAEYGAEAIFIDEDKNVYLTEGAGEHFQILEKEYRLSDEEYNKKN